MSTSLQKTSPVPTDRALDLGGTVIVIFLCMCWGLNQIAIKYALPDIPPLTQAAIRSSGAAILIWLYARARGISLEMRDPTLAAGVLVGSLFALEFALLYWGLIYTTASRAVLFLYLAPFVVVLGSYFRQGSDRFDWMQWAGLLMSFLGMAIAFGFPGPDTTREQIIGDAMIFGAAVAWGLTTLAVKGTSLAAASPEKTLQYQLVISAPVFMILAWLFGEQINNSPSALAMYSMIYQTVWVVAFTFVLWFTLVAKYSANRLSAYTLLTPLFGVAAGHFVLGDPFTPAFAAAVILVIAGLAVVNRQKKTR